MDAYRQTGFTLIEIMITVAILAIISAIAIPIYQGYIAEARIGTAITDIRQAELILNDRFLDNDPPASLADVDIDLVDPWGNAYRYQTPATRKFHSKAGESNAAPLNYDLASNGPDGTANTADDIVRGCNGEFVGVAADHPNNASANGC